jgi:DNA-binding winged helix-turn-helix (wHTH) protein
MKQSLVQYQNWEKALKIFPPFRLDTTNQYLWRSTDERAEERIALKPKTYSILAYFLDHPGRLVTQHELLDAVWPETYVQPEVVKRHIFDLREALGDNSKTPSFLETLPRRGYQFIAPIHEAGRTCSRNSPGVKLVGRDRALGELETCLHRAMRGERQIVFVTGEAGIGKTALVNEFQRRAAQGAPLRLSTGQCVEGYGGKEPTIPCCRLWNRYAGIRTQVSCAFSPRRDGSRGPGCWHIHDSAATFRKGSNRVDNLSLEKVAHNGLAGRAKSAEFLIRLTPRPAACAL